MTLSKKEVKKRKRTALFRRMEEVLGDDFPALLNDTMEIVVSPWYAASWRNDGDAKAQLARLLQERHALSARAAEIAVQQLNSLYSWWHVMGWALFPSWPQTKDDKTDHDMRLRWVEDKGIREVPDGDVPEWSIPAPTVIVNGPFETLTRNVATLRARLAQAREVHDETDVFIGWMDRQALRAGDRHLAYLARALTGS